MVCLAHCRQELQQKSSKTARLFLQDRDQDQDQMFKTKTKTFIFVLKAPRDQDPGLEDYITVENASLLRPEAGCALVPGLIQLTLTDYVPRYGSTSSQSATC